MKLLTSRELAKAAKLDMPGGVFIARALMQIFRYNKLNRVYSSAYDSDPDIFITSILEQLDIRVEVPESDLEHIPATGPFITVSNHPFGGIDVLILLKLLRAHRPDIMALANFLLQNIDPIRDHIVPLDQFEEVLSVRSSYRWIKEGLTYLKDGHVISIFPAGEVSTYQSETNLIIDREWSEAVVKFIKMAGVPVIPVYFHGTNSRWFHILGRIHPLLRTVRLASEIVNKKHKVIKVRIGKPISVREQADAGDTARLGRYLRARTYSLGSALEGKRFFLPFRTDKAGQQVPVADPVDPARLRDEFNAVRSSCELFSNKNYTVIFAPTRSIPNIFEEIGRLREITFRAVGEGTNKASDTDEYDFYYNHLVVWDNDTGSVVGAYRIGKGREILSQYGLKGFYLSSLFRISPSFEPYMAESLELGRSFIVPEYQRKALPLFLLWKGLLTVLLTHAEYRYLIGPVSISNEFSDFSKSLIVEFVRSHFYDAELAKHIKPRKRFSHYADKRVDSSILIDTADNDISKVEKVVSDVDGGFRLPVLLKKYLEMNARIIGFNVDPDFSNCLDGLIMLDIYRMPPDFVKALSKDLNEETVMKRFLGGSPETGA